MPTDHNHHAANVQHAATLNLGIADELLVGLFALQRGCPKDVLPGAHAKLIELELVDRDGKLDIVALALLDLVASSRRNAMPYRTSSRTCFAVAWYTDELDAEARGYDVRDRRVNGGFCAESRCGRDEGFDCYAGVKHRGDVHRKLFAVVVP